MVYAILGEKSSHGMEGEGVRGLKATGVKELTYKTAFLACSVQVTNFTTMMMFSCVFFS